MTDGCHVAPEPIEAPEPRPVERQRDLVRSKAIAWGWRVMIADGEPLSSVDAYEAYLACHERRAR